MFQRTKCRAAKGCFQRKAPRSKYTESGCQKQWVWREATTLLRHPHSLATRMRHSDDDRHLHELRKENSGPVGVFAPAGTPARVVFSHRTQPGHSPRSAVQLLPRETSFKLRPSAVTTGAPMPCHVAADSPNPSLLGPSLNHPLTRYFLLHAAPACA